MKKNIKILSVVAFFIGVILLNSSVQAASTNKMVLPIETTKVQLERKDTGNTTTIQLKEGEYYQEVDKLSNDLQEAIKGNETKHIPAGVVFYIPVPEGYSDKYTEAKLYDSTNKQQLYTTNFVDENFEQISLASGLTKEAKYIRSAVTVGSTIYSKEDNYTTGVSRFLGGKKTVGIIYYDENGNATEPVEYTVIVKPKFSIKELKIGVINPSYVYNI